MTRAGWGSKKNLFDKIDSRLFSLFVWNSFSEFIDIQLKGSLCNWFKVIWILIKKYGPGLNPATDGGVRLSNKIGIVSWLQLQFLFVYGLD